MKYLILITLLFLSACKSTVEYRDREIYVPRNVLQVCVKEYIDTECSIKINTYRDLAQCYIELKENSIFINKVIKDCNIKEEQ